MSNNLISDDVVHAVFQQFGWNTSVSRETNSLNRTLSHQVLSMGNDKAHYEFNLFGPKSILRAARLKHELDGLNGLLAHVFLNVSKASYKLYYAEGDGGTTLRISIYPLDDIPDYQAWVFDAGRYGDPKDGIEAVKKLMAARGKARDRLKEAGFHYEEMPF